MWSLAKMMTHYRPTDVMVPLFYFLDMSLVNISAYSVPSSISPNTLVEGSPQKEMPQEHDHEERESEISSSPDSDPETLPRRSTRECHAPKRYGIVAQNIAISIVAQGVIKEILRYPEALRSSESHLWKEAMDDEVKSLKTNHTWDLVDTPKNHKILCGKCVYKVKYGIDGKNCRYKACWVAKGFEQRESIDFEEKFSPIVKSCTTRILSALVEFYGWSVEQMDAVIAYLNIKINVVLYIEAPTGYMTLGKVCLFRKTIYGLKKSARQWCKDLSRSIIRAGLKRLISDNSVFAKNLGTRKVVIIIVCVDHFLFFGPDIQEINTVKKYLADRYKMKDLWPCGQFTGIKLDRDTDNKKISLSQEVYFRKALNHVGMSDCKPALSPIVANIDLTGNPEDASDEELIRNY